MLSSSFSKIVSMRRFLTRKNSRSATRWLRWIHAGNTEHTERGYPLMICAIGQAACSLQSQSVDLPEKGSLMSTSISVHCIHFPWDDSPDCAIHSNHNEHSHHSWSYRKQTYLSFPFFTTCFTFVRSIVLVCVFMTLQLDATAVFPRTNSTLECAF